MTDSNETYEACTRQILSKHVFERMRQFNIEASTVLIVIGIISNSLAIFVFSKKKFLVNSTSVYLLCLSICDIFFFITHLFEDTLRTFIDRFLNKNIDVHVLCQNHPENKLYQLSGIYLFDMDSSVEQLARYMNITDRSHLFCIVFTYMRYSLRLVSAYLIVTFTIHRAIIIHRPYSELNHDSKRLAWINVSFIVLFAIISNSWIDYFTERTGGMHIQFCDIKRDYQHAYFLITMAYIFVIMLLPIIIIFVSNTFIITRILHVNRQREKMFLESYCMVMSPRDSKAHASLVAVERDLKIMKRSSEPITHSTQNSRIKKFKRSSIENLRLDEIDHPTIDNFVKQANSVVHKASQNTKINTMLMFMSFSFALLNLPYFITWLIFFVGVAFGRTLADNRVSEIDRSTIINKIFSANYVSEVFYILSYTIHFFIYCASSKRFRRQLKQSLGCNLKNR